MSFDMGSRTQGQISKTNLGALGQMSSPLSENPRTRLKLRKKMRTRSPDFQADFALAARAKRTKEGKEMNFSQFSLLLSFVRSSQQLKPRTTKNHPRLLSFGDKIFLLLALTYILITIIVQFMNFLSKKNFIVDRYSCLIRYVIGDIWLRNL